MTHEYTYKQEILDFSLRLILFVKKCKIIIKNPQDLVAHEKPEEGFSKEKSLWYNFSKTPKHYRYEVFT